MKTLFWYYLILFVTGLAILCWPEKNTTMIIRMSENHGPSSLDVAGLLILSIGYVPMILTVIKRFKDIRMELGDTRSFMLVVISISALTLIAVSLYITQDMLLWISVAVSTICQSILTYQAFRNNGS
jgi:hypothetical protein